MARSTFLVATVALFAPTLAAQPHPLVGVWQMTYPGGMRIENGTPTPISTNGKLTVEAKGDSLIAVLATEATAPDGTRRPDVRLAAARSTGKVVFVQTSRATVNINGNEQQATSTSTWILTVEGDELVGTVERKLEGVDHPAGGPQPVRGKRVGG